MAKTAVYATIDTLTYEEYKRATKPIRARAMLVCVIAAEVLAILMCSFTKASLLTAVVLPLAVIVVSFSVNASNTKRKYKSNIAYLRNIKYTFDEKGLCVSDGTQTQSCRWTQIQRLDMDAKYILIYPNRRSVNLIPRRCLNPGDGDRIAAFYNKAMEKKRK